MKKSKAGQIAKSIFTIIIAICVFTGITALTGGYEVSAATPVKISKSKVTMYVGTSTTLKMTGTKAKVKWSTSSKKVAAVSSKGKVSAKKAGTATIKAKVGKKTYKCKVVVKKAPKLNKTKMTVYAGKSSTLKLSGYKIGKTTWSSSNKSVAKVSSSGKVTGLKKGTAYIYAKTAGKTLKCKVTVKTIGISYMYLNKSQVSAKPGQTYTLKPIVTPSNATLTNKKWWSDDKSVATVDQNGKVKVVGPGTAYVYFKAGGKTTSALFLVSPIKVESVTLNKTTLEMAPGDKYQLTAKVLPKNASYPEVKWDVIWGSQYATVDNTGKVTALKEGKANIRAYADGKYQYCEVTVKDVDVEEITLSDTKLTMTVGKTHKLTANVLPENATDRNVTWTTSNTKIAKVDAQGNVTAIGTGTARIYAKAGGKSVTCIVNVEPEILGNNDVWEVNGEWSFKINAVKSHYKCSSAGNDKGKHVIVVDYTYTNKGYVNDYGGLYFFVGDFDVYDESGNAGASYSCTYNCSERKDYQKVVEGYSCTASQAFILLEDSETITLAIEKYNSSGNKEVARYVLDVEGTYKDSTDLIKKYINENGLLDEDGNKKVTSGSEKIESSVKYDSAADLLVYEFIMYYGTNNEYADRVAMTLDGSKNGDAYVVAAGKNNYGTYVATATIDPSSMTESSDYSFALESGTLTSGIASQYANATLQAAMDGWSLKMAGMGIETGFKKLGFVKGPW